VAAPGDTIQFGVTGTILLGSMLTVTKNVTIQGPGAGSLAVHGQNAVRVFQVNGGVQAALVGITIRNGNADQGGGIRNNGGTVALTNSTLSGNAASLFGGGIYNNEGTVTLAASTLTSNSAVSFGGGIESNRGAVTITNSTLNGNTSELGGGIASSSGRRRQPSL